MSKNNFLRGECTEVLDVLRAYKRGRRALESRMALERSFWQEKCVHGAQSNSSSWLFNSIVSKHADIIDNMPICTCLPREECDEADAELLTSILPVIVDRCGFKEQYSDNAWKKLKYGAAFYGVFWNSSLDGGLGDIDIRALRVEDVFWEPGIRDIQESKNLFICRIWDIDALHAAYPDLCIDDVKRDADSIAYDIYGGGLDCEGKCMIIDRYYKKVDEQGNVRLHLCKMCGSHVLYGSEDDSSCKGGWYEHGMYPVVVDSLYPDEESIHGFGVISVAKKAQDDIDRIDGNLLEYADWASRVRFWAKKSLGINEDHFGDLSRRIVEVEGDIDDERLKQIETARIDESVIELRELKIDELKETTGTRDFLQGGTTGGVIAATAIKRLQDSGDKYSRDGIEGSCRAYARIMTLVIELMRQFYDVPRYFRIKGECGDNKYRCYSNILSRGERENAELARRPHFDIEISTSKKSVTYADTANALARELYESGAFKPENAEQTLIMLELMSFDGVGRIKKMVKDMLSEYRRRTEEQGAVIADGKH